METLSTEDLGQFYDDGSQLFELIIGANFHFGFYPEGNQNISMAAAQEMATEMVIKRVGILANQHLLDVGSGLGRPALRIARETGCKVTGLTVSRVQVTEANRRAAAEGLAEKVVFQHADAMHMPFADGTFDAAWAMETLYHMRIPDRLQALREIRRVLVPGGRVVIEDLICRASLPEDGEMFLQRFLALQSRVLLPEYEQLVVESGLELVEVQDISANTLPHLPKILEGIEARKDDLAQSFGGEAGLSHFRDEMHKTAELYEKYLGHALIVARNA
jgi:cyclopropane fatty-acyl-phospholipid synthase-like methyltransferase